ncbi:MAG TPA: SCO family protein [Gallionellaceae bacterium]
MKSIANFFCIALALAAAGTIGPIAGVALAHDMDDMQDMHAHHHMMPMPVIKRQTATYTVPEVTLVRDDGKRVALRDELNDGRPVILNFIYTTCTSVCPLVSHTLEQLQSKLGSDRDRVHLVSISIDPEQDTPARLAAYAKEYEAGPEWQHYTGTVAASITTQRAFDAYRGDKMNHTPVTFLRAAPGQPWIRIEGFVTPDDLLGEIRSMLVASASH